MRSLLRSFFWTKSLKQREQEKRRDGQRGEDSGAEDSQSSGARGTPDHRSLLMRSAQAAKVVTRGC